MTNLTGLWEGQYKYPNSWQPVVSFDADISDNSGVLSGIISEPNTFDPDAGHLLTSAIAGSVRGDQVEFIKTYVGEGYAHHSLNYSGFLSDKGLRISGRWVTADGSFSGRFEMTRLSSGEEALHSEADTVILNV